MPQTNAASLANLEKRARGRTTPNKFNASIKEMVEGALRKVGGVDYLARQAEQNPVAFMGLVGRVLPLQLAGHDGGKLEVEFRWKDDPPATTTINGTATEQDDAPQITFIGEC